MTAQTFSTDFPTTPGAFQTRHAGLTDAFVAKLNPAGNGLVYSTFLGGSAGEAGNAIAVDSSGNAYVAGTTSSTNFPTATPFQSAKGAGIFNVFVTKLNAAGSALVYSSYLGGSASDQGTGLALDSSGNVYVTGSAASQDFPTTPGAFQTVFGGGQQDAFVAKVSAAGALAYSTYLGGSGNEVGRGIAVDSSGNAYVTGFTQSANFPTANAFQATLRSSFNAFVTKLNAAGSALVYSSYLGGSGGDFGIGIGVDSARNAYVIGSTSSTDFPTAIPLQSALSGPSDVFLTQVNPSGNRLLFSTYLGGSANDNGNAIALDSAGGAAYLGITSNSPNFTNQSTAGITPQDTNPNPDAGRGAKVNFCITDLQVMSLVAPATVPRGFLTNPPSHIFQVKVVARNNGPDDDNAVLVTLAISGAGGTLHSRIVSQTVCAFLPPTFGCEMPSKSEKEITMSVVIFADTIFPPNLPVSAKLSVFISGKCEDGHPENDSVSQDIVVVDNPEMDSAGVNGKSLKVHVKKAPPSGTQGLATSIQPQASGPVIVLNGEDQKTRPDDQDPTSTFIAKKAGKKIKPGETVTLQVRFSDLIITPEFTFTRPQ